MGVVPVPLVRVVPVALPEEVPPVLRGTLQKGDAVAPGEHREGRIEIRAGTYVNTARNAITSLEMITEMIADESDDLLVDGLHDEVVVADVLMGIKVVPPHVCIQRPIGGGWRSGGHG
ncbi:hypothetical protein GCM10010226_14650 [Streptomyces phaeofaciens]|uniref:Uncharacterized protein n=1 Tax=Streptomyces phaeofaciens TaxID=68254 RepID=A0A918LQK5_9ACTN|nr:hypothetical protein GCM10010226_14650 [Streptomyces phaeofaciens]